MTWAGVLLWCSKHPALVRAAALALVTVMIVSALAGWGYSRGVRHDAGKVQAAQQQAHSAVAQGEVNAAAAVAADAASLTAAQAQQQAQEAAHDIHALPGAPQALDPALRARWRTGLGDVQRGAGQPAGPRR